MASSVKTTALLDIDEIYPKGRPERIVALLGNPNVGKSTIFNHVTGLEVITAHYPGKTPDINISDVEIDGTTVALLDVPGTYSIEGPAEEQWVARRALLDARPDVTIVVLDTNNLSRNLTLGLEVLDLGRPVVFAANLSDEAERAGIQVDVELLSALLGAPVVRTVAVDGLGIAELMSAALVAADSVPELPRHRYGETFERALRALTETVSATGARPFALAARPASLQLVGGHDDVEDELRHAGDEGLVRVAEEARRAIAALAGEPPNTALARERHGAAGVIADRCVSVKQLERPRIEEVLLRVSTRASTGVPILVGLLAGLFAVLFFVGEWLSRGVSLIWAATFSPLIQDAVHALVGTGALAKTLLWGLDAGVEASLAIGIPYILTFYFLLGILEDSGYLNAVTFLADHVMHKLGLHGRAVIPLVAGAGCSVPAVLAVRALPRERDRFIASTLVAMVPCSARTAVILGAVGAYVGAGPALAVFGVSAVVTVGVGIVMNRMLPGTSTGMVIEMFPFRRPRLAAVWRKAWSQFREFLTVALPLVVAGSVLLGGLYETGWLAKLSAPLEPVTVGLLGLPAFAGITLLFGLLRKEFALQLLLTIAIATAGASAGAGLRDIMSPANIIVYTLVNTLAMPCVSTVAVLGKVLGPKRAGTVMVITVGVALFVGAFVARVLPLLGRVGV